MQCCVTVDADDDGGVGDNSGGVGDDGGDDGDSMRNIKTCLYAYLFTKFLRISFKYADVGLPMAEY